MSSSNVIKTYTPLPTMTTKSTRILRTMMPREYRKQCIEIMNSPPAKVGPLPWSTLMNAYSNSQDCQEFLLVKQFAHRQHIGKGLFIEFGSRDGVHESNTILLEETLGWRGILLEAVPHERGDIVKNRPNSIIMAGAVCAKGTAKIHISKRGGWHGINIDHQRLSDNRGDTISIKCFPLDEIIKRFGIKRVNYLSVDTEGSEFEALKTFPFDTITADVIGVEILFGTPVRKKNKEAIILFLKSKGYYMFEEMPFGDDTSDLFFRPKITGSADDIMYDPKQFESGKNDCIKSGDCLG